MFRSLLFVSTILLLAACASTGSTGMNTSAPCTQCKEHCQCGEVCQCKDCKGCKDCENCSHCAHAKGADAEKPCQICLESERASSAAAQAK